MSGPQFFETGMGRKYYEGTMPRIAKALEAIAKELEAIRKALDATSPKGTAPVVPDADETAQMLADYRKAGESDRNNEVTD